MNVQIQSVKFDADKKLIEFVENKMSKLERFTDRATGAEVILKLDKDFEKGNKVATITLHMPGEDMVAEHRAAPSRRRSTRRSTHETPDREIQGEGEIAARRHAWRREESSTRIPPRSPFPESAPAASAAIPLLYEVPAPCEKTDTMPVGGGGAIHGNFFPAKRTTCRFFIYICLEDIFEEKHVQQPHGSELVVALIGFK